MNARKAKQLRRQVYGEGQHPGPVRYALELARPTMGADPKAPPKGRTWLADVDRMNYQEAKRNG